MVASVGAVVVAWIAGAALVERLWPRAQPLPALEWAALAGLLGPAIVGVALLGTGASGLSGAIAIPVITVAATAAGALALRHHRQRPPTPRSRGSMTLVVLLALSVAAAGAISLRTHLGWDGTVVWYHKARVIAASGVMPAAALADRTRAWTAPDYPLQVPLALAWVRRWQAVEDETALKVLPAAWCAAIFCLVVASVRERSRDAPDAHLRAACALLVIGTAPRMLIGEGSFTSGYADGPVAGLLAALAWIAWRSDWGRAPGWQPLLACLAASLAWTKQEGLVGVLAVAVACAWRTRALSALAWAVPAVTIAGAWPAWATWHGAPAAMAYTWPGVRPAVSRVPAIAQAYLEEAARFRTWGLLWPGLATAVVLGRAPGTWLPLLVTLGVIGMGAAAFVVSAWPDLAMHLQVTVPRLGVQVAPLLAITAFAAGTRD
jgi:hypothetical protein